jgi:very-short-patch-repair endonuclease
MRSLLRSGDLVRMRHGVYANRAAVAWAEEDPRRRHALEVLAVTRSVGRDSVASHHSAAVIHGLDLLGAARPGVVTLTRPPSRPSGRPRSDGIAFHVAALPAEHVTKRWGISVTSAPRTVVDLARALPFADGVVVADSALRLGRATKSELSGVVNSCGQWPGVDRARRTVAFADERAESVLESCARVVFRERGLEAPELQAEFRGEGFVYRGDFYWARHRTIAEADGMAKYEDPGRARDQIRRDRLLRDAGYKVVHFTWRELFETPDAVIARIRTAFAARTPF